MAGVPGKAAAARAPGRQGSASKGTAQHPTSRAPATTPVHPSCPPAQGPSGRLQTKDRAASHFQEPLPA